MTKRQSMLFNIPKREDITKKILEKTTVVDTKPQALNITSANRFQQVIQMAKQLMVDRDDIENVTDLDYINRYVDKAIENGIIAIDTEGTGLNPIRDQVVGVCLYTPGEKGIYIPVSHRSHMTNEIRDGQVDPKVIIELLEKIQKSGVKQIYHNYKYDARMIKNTFGVWMTPYWDTFLCSVILNENEVHSLKVLHGKYVEKGGKDNLKYAELFDDFDFGLVPLDMAYRYAAYDPIMTYELYKFQEDALERPQLAGLKNTFMNIEMKITPFVAEMEETGNCIDMAHADYLKEKYTKLMNERHENVMGEIEQFRSEINTFRKKYPHKAVKLEEPINLSSPIQLSILLYDILKVDVVDKKKPRGTGKDILKALDIPLTKALLEYREVETLVNTFITKLPKCVEPKTGKLHGNFNQAGTDTGRFSSSDPNLQNIPSQNKEIRKMFTAPDGYVMVGGDYSQQEPRCLAYLSQDEHLLNAYREGKDVYADMASKIYRVPYEECKEFRADGSVNPEGKKRRGNVKSIVLGLLYGRQAKSVAEQTGMTQQEAEALIVDFFNAFEGVEKFIKESQEKCRKVGYVEMIWGRKRRIADMKLSPYEFTGRNGEPLPPNVVNNYMKKLNNMRGKQKDKLINEARQLGVYIKDNTWMIGNAERKVVNSIIQGSSAEITKKAMILIGQDKLLREKDFKMVLTIHDEIVGICPEENAKICADRMAELMMKAPSDKIDIPMKVDTEVTRCWYGEALEFDEEGRIIEE